MDGSSGSSGNEGRAGGKEAPGAAAPGAIASASAPDLAALARDWIELWQSELTALAADPETIDGWGRLAALWAGAAASGIAAMPRGAQHDRHAPFPGPFATAFGAPPAWPAAPWPSAGTGPAASAGAAPAAAASEPGGVATERLLQRVLDRLDAIERRLAALEGRGGGGEGRADRGRAGRSRG